MNRERQPRAVPEVNPTAVPVSELAGHRPTTASELS
jgi:hypothetical protein